MTSLPLSERRILVIEDEYYLAMDVERELTAAGAVVIGPVPSVEQALALVSAERDLDAAVLDVNLGGEMAYSVADALQARGVPFVFTTGYGDGELNARYPGITRCEKPLDFRKLAAALTSALKA